jgi:hypothetical protein
MKPIKETSHYDGGMFDAFSEDALKKEWKEQNYSAQMDPSARNLIQERGKTNQYKSTRLFESLYKTNHYVEMSDFLKEKYGDDLYFSINHNVGISNFDKIGSNFPQSMLDDLRNKNKKLVIDMSEEAVYAFVDYVYQNLVINLNIPEEQLIYIGASPDYYSYIDEVSKKYNKKPIHCEHFWFFERQAKQFFIEDMVGSTVSPLPNKISYSSPLKGTSFKKKFLHLNRNWRSHRFATLCLLYSRDLLKESYASFHYPENRNEKVWEKWHSAMLLDFKDAPYHQELVDGYNVKDILPLHLDIDNYLVNGAYFSQRKISSYLRSTYFSLVSETIYKNNNPRFLTEKIFKPVVFKHPFILISLPNSLELFRSLGYKTFDGIIDERYDLEVDENKRLDMVIEETKRLCNLTSSELEEFKNKCLPIVDHNFEVMMNKNKLEDYWSK